MVEFQIVGGDASTEELNVIFPILKDVGNAKTQLVGTGFFIGRFGHFVTAKHVIFDVIDGSTGKQKAGLHALHFVVGTEALVRNILKASFHNTGDVAVGRMDFHKVIATGKPLRNAAWRTRGTSTSAQS